MSKIISYQPKLLHTVYKKIVDQVNQKFNYVVNRQRNFSQKMFCYMQLSKLISEEFFMPLTSWSVSPNLILHVLNEIEINNRKRIIEFGSGASTIYIAKLLKLKYPGSKFISVESDQAWADKIYAQLKQLHLTDFVEIVVAKKSSVAKDFIYKSQNAWYDMEVLSSKLSKVDDIDLVLVDGPPASFSKYSRYSAVPFLKAKLHSNFAVFIDDTNRNEEKEIAQRWKIDLNCNVRFFDDYAILTNEGNFSTMPMKV